MKKRYLFVMSTLSLAVVSACGDTAEPVSGIQEESNLTLQQVFEKALERQQNLESVHAVTTMDQVTSFMMDGEVIQFTSASNLEMNIQQNPIAMYVNGTVEMAMGHDNFEMPLEMYMTDEDGFYILNGDTDEWYKLPEEQYTQMLAQTGVQADATKQLKQLEPFVDDFTFKQDNEQYLLTLSIQGEQFKQFILSQLGASLGESLDMNGDILANMSFEDSQYNIVVAKDTFDTMEIDLGLKMITNIEGQETTIENNATIVYSQFDEIKTIEIPKVVKNKAIIE